MLGDVCSYVLVINLINAPFLLEGAPFTRKVKSTDMPSMISIQTLALHSLYCFCFNRYIPYLIFTAAD